MSITVNAGVQSRRSLSRAMNRTPSSTPVGGPSVFDLRQPHERRDEQERREVGRRVDVQDVRGADQADQDARQRRPEEDGEAIRSLEQRRCLRHLRLLLADELRDHRALHREVRREEDARHGDEGEQHGEGERARGVQQRGSRRTAARARGRT